MMMMMMVAVAVVVYKSRVDVVSLHLLVLFLIFFVSVAYLPRRQ